jgi:hypothetical protein
VGGERVLRGGDMGGERVLPGGNMGGAVRAGATVRRTAGAWTPTLCHEAP